MRPLWLMVATVVMVTSADIASAEDIPNRKEIEFSALIPAEQVVDQIQAMRTAVRERSCMKLAAWTQFPFRINSPGQKSKWLWNRTAFCRYFSSVFDETRSSAFLDQKLEETPQGYRGLSFWKSGIWVQPICPDDPKSKCPNSALELRLVAVNL